MATYAQVGDLPYYVDGARKKSVTDISFDSSYPTGGEAAAPSNLRLDRIDYATAQIQSAATTTVNSASAAWASNKVLVYDETPAEVSNGSNLEGLVVRVTAWGN